LTTRTDYLAGAQQIDYRIYGVLQSWITNEANNLEGFIDNPSEHVNYNKYIIFDYTALNNRLTLLRSVADYMNTITQYKAGNPNYSESMFENALDNIPSAIFQRLLDWLNTRTIEMQHIINSNGDPNNVSPLQDYVGMFTFDTNKFGAEYTMYTNSLDGVKTVVDYKVEQESANSTTTTTTTAPTPSQDGPTGTV
jgi:hypothetical protein